MPDLTAAEVFRDYATDGVPASGRQKPKKSEIRRLLKQYETITTAFTSNGGLIYASKASMDADLAHAAKASAWVTGDTTAANNGIYQKQGGSGTGSWTRVADLPYSFIVASDIGDGTPNAIQATTAIPVSNSALVWLNIFEANTASPVTVAFNGGTALTIKTNSGNDVAAGGLVSGMVVMGIVSGATFRLVSDQASAAIVAAAEDAADRAEAAAATVELPPIAPNRMLVDNAAGTVRESKTFPEVRSFLDTAPYVPTRTALKTLDTTKDTTAILTEDGRVGIINWKTGDHSAQIAADPTEGVYFLANGVPATVGAWVRYHDGVLNACWCGATAGAADGTFSFDSGAAFNSAFALAGFIGATVNIPSGFYLSSIGLTAPTGITVEGLGANENWEIPFFDLASMTIYRGVTICFTGNGARNQTLDYCSAMHHSGAYRTNISRPYMTANDQYFEATDLTNGDAVGTTKATLKPFSAALTLGSDGLSGKTIFRNIRFVPACDDGVNGPLAGYLATNMNAYVAWSEWDFGCYTLNPYAAVLEDCQFVGFWHRKAYLQTSIRFGSTQVGGRGEMALSYRNYFQGGLAIRSGDFYPVLSKTASTIVIAWSPGHRFNTSGSVFIDSVSYAYTGLTYSAAGEGTLTFTGIADTSAVVTSGDDRSVLHMTNNNGTTQTAFRDCNIRDFWHPSLVERPSPAFGAQAGKYSAAIELVGYPIRGILFENNTKYCQEPLFLLMQGARELYFDLGTMEEKNYRTALGGPLNPSGAPHANAIVGPTTAHLANWPMLQRGSISLKGYPWSGRTNITPVGLVASGRRYSAFTDAFNPFYFSPGNVFGNGGVFDARKPERYVISGDTITVYDGDILIDTEGGAATDNLVSMKAPAWINRVCLRTNSSTRDVTLVSGTLPEQFNMSASNVTLFSPLQCIVFVRTGPAAAWTIEGNYGTNGTFANVTTVGGIVVSGT